MQQRRRDLVPLAVRYAVRDVVGGWGLYSVAAIGELFLVEGFGPAAQYKPTASGARRQEADAFHAAIDCTSPEQVGRYLKVMERILDDHDNDDVRDRYERPIAEGRHDLLDRPIADTGQRRTNIAHPEACAGVMKDVLANLVLL